MRLLQADRSHRRSTWKLTKSFGCILRSPFYCSSVHSHYCIFKIWSSRMQILEYMWCLTKHALIFFKKISHERKRQVGSWVGPPVIECCVVFQEDLMWAGSGSHRTMGFVCRGEALTQCELKISYNFGSWNLFVKFWSFIHQECWAKTFDIWNQSPSTLRPGSTLWHSSFTKTPNNLC